MVLFYMFQCFLVIKILENNFNLEINVDILCFENFMVIEEMKLL